MPINAEGYSIHGQCENWQDHYEYMNSSCQQGSPGFISEGVFAGPTKTLAKSNAREQGWLIGRNGRVYCPTCVMNGRWK